MDMQERILKAAQEVLAQLQAQVAQHVAAQAAPQSMLVGIPQGNATVAAGSAISALPSMALLSGLHAALPVVQVLAPRTEGIVARLVQVLGAGYQWVFQGEAYAENAVQRYVLPMLSCSSLAAFATGQAPTPADAAVLALLLHGKVVEVLEFEHHNFRATAPAALYGLYAAHEATVATFGLCPVRLPAPAEVLHTDRLVTEADVTKAHASGTATLAVLEQAIVTPLAAEVAAQCGITIVKRL